MRLWYSNSDWSIPWENSAWYGVYDVMNSDLPITESTADGIIRSYIPQPMKFA